MQHACRCHHISNQELGFPQQTQYHLYHQREYQTIRLRDSHRALDKVCLNLAFRICLWCLRCGSQKGLHRICNARYSGRYHPLSVQHISNLRPMGFSICWLIKVRIVRLSPSDNLCLYAACFFLQDAVGYVISKIWDLEWWVDGNDDGISVLYGISPLNSWYLILTSC